MLYGLFSIIFSFFFVLLGNFNLVYGNEIIRLKVEGELYEIKEKDGLEEIYERVRSVDMIKLRERVIASAEKLLVLKSELNKACENRTFSFYPYYVLPFDIKDEKGRIIYPKGFMFNPLDSLQGLISHYIFVFFDGNSEREVKWLLSNRFYVEKAILIATGGDIRELVKIFKRPVYVFNKEMKERFRVERTPSIARFNGSQVVIDEIGVYDCKAKIKKYKK